MNRYLLFSLSVTACGGAGAATTSTPDAGAPQDGSTPRVCDPSNLQGIHVPSTAGPNPLDPLGYPPYALDACRLVYTAQTGELRLRDLTTGAEGTIASASEQARRPVVAGDVVAWEGNVAGKWQVRVLTGGATTTLSGAFDHAGEPRATADAVAFTAWLGADDNGDTDVYLYLPASRTLVPAATGPGQQRFADVSASLVAISDFSEDPAGRFNLDAMSLADIVIVDRKTMAKTTRHLDGEQAFPMLGADEKLAYLSWKIHPEPKFSSFMMLVGNASSLDATADSNVKAAGADITTNTPYDRPTVRGGVAEWVDESGGAGGLFRRPLDLSAAATNPVNGVAVLGPVAGESMTVLAAWDGAAKAYALRGVVR